MATEEILKIYCPVVKTSNLESGSKLHHCLFIEPRLLKIFQLPHHMKLLSALDRFLTSTHRDLHMREGLGHIEGIPYISKFRGFFDFESQNFEF